MPRKIGAGVEISRSGRTGWLGRKGSNLRMLESKSSALPLGDAPSCGQAADHIEGVKGFQRGENAKRPPRRPGNSKAFGRLRGRGAMAIRALPRDRPSKPSGIGE